jgi:hypothetical protein
MKAELQAVSLRMQTMRASTQMSEAMRGVTRIMMGMNRQIQLPQMQMIMREFEKQSEVMDMKEEMMNDAIDDVMEGEDEEEETEEVISKILDEIGINLNSEVRGIYLGLITTFCLFLFKLLTRMHFLATISCFLLRLALSNAMQKPLTTQIRSCRVVLITYDERSLHPCKLYGRHSAT